MSSRIARTLTIAVFAAGLAACSSVPLDQSAGGTGSGNGSANTGQIMDPFNPQSPLAQQRSVYFDFDSRSEEHTSELQSLMRISYAGFCLKKKTKQSHNSTPDQRTRNE